MDILMLGKSNAGKTSYVSAMYEAMSNGVGGFSVRAERSADHQRLRRVARQMHHGAYPDASSRRSVYPLQLWHEQERVFDFVWRDYRGGALTEGSDSPQAAQLREDMKTAGGLVLMVDSTQMTGGARARSAVRPLISTTINLLSQREEIMPIVVALTKWDLVKANTRQINAATTDLLGDLMSAVRDTGHLYGTRIPVACGVDPVNVILPVLWCLHVGIAVRGAVLEHSIDYHDRLAGLARSRQGWWDDVRSWWRKEPTWRDVGVLAEQQVYDDMRNLRPLVTSLEKLERLLDPVEKF